MSNDVRLNQRAISLALLLSATLAISKIIAWYLDGSVAVLASAADSALDFVSSLANLMALIFAQKPPDRNHRFGHGKIEALAGLFQALIIFVSVGFILWRSYERFRSSAIPNVDVLSVGVMVFSVLATLFLVWQQRRITKKTGSLVVSADSLHYTGDVAANIGVLLALVLAPIPGLAFIDPAVAAIMSIYVGYAGFSVIKKSVDILIDKDKSHLFRHDIDEILANYKQILGFHDLRTRSDGVNYFLEIHLEMPPQLSLKESHDLGEEVSQAIQNRHPRTQIIVHVDPYGDNEGQTWDNLN